MTSSIQIHEYLCENIEQFENKLKERPLDSDSNLKVRAGLTVLKRLKDFVESDKRDTKQKLEVTAEDVSRWMLRFSILNHKLDKVEAEMERHIEYYKTKMFSEDRRSRVYQKNEASMQATSDAVKLLRIARDPEKV